MQLGCDATGRPTRAIAYREIESFKPITGVVVVDITDDGFILRSASFPDILKIKNGKNRRQVESIIKPIKEIAFDPHSGKRAVNTVSEQPVMELKHSITSTTWLGAPLLN